MGKGKQLMDRPYATSLHMPSIWKNCCLSVLVKVEERRKHYCWMSNKSANSVKGFEDMDSAGRVWGSFLQMLHYKVLLGIAEIFSQKYDEIFSKAFRESTKGKMHDLRKVLGGLSGFASEELEAELIARDPKVMRDLKKAREQARKGELHGLEEVLKEIKKEKKEEQKKIPRQSASSPRESASSEGRKKK